MKFRAIFKQLSWVGAFAFLILPLIYFLGVPFFDWIDSWASSRGWELTAGHIVIGSAAIPFLYAIPKFLMYRFRRKQRVNS